MNTHGFVFDGCVQINREIFNIFWLHTIMVYHLEYNGRRKIALNTPFVHIWRLSSR